MILSRVVPAPVEVCDTSSEEFDEWLRDHYRPDRSEWLRLNMIASVNGSATGRDGTSETLSSRTDRRILGALRALSDVVLVGAATVRTEGYVLPRSAALAVVTRTGNLRGARLDRTGPRGALLVLCPRSAASEVRTAVGTVDARVLPVDDTDGDLPASAIVNALRREGLSSIVCEGGPALAAHLIQAQLVDELCLSTSPMLASPGLPLLPPDSRADAELSLRQLLVDEQSGLYSRWSYRTREAIR